MAKHPTTKAIAGKQFFDAQPQLNQSISIESKPSPWRLNNPATVLAVLFLPVYLARLDHVV